VKRAWRTYFLTVEPEKTRGNEETRIDGPIFFKKSEVSHIRDTYIGKKGSDSEEGCATKSAQKKHEKREITTVRPSGPLKLRLNGRVATNGAKNFGTESEI